MTKPTTVVVTFLEMAAAADHRRQRRLPADVELRREAPPAAAPLAASLYRTVGAAWNWRDRLSWSDAAWGEAVHRDGVELWVARIGGTIVGYFELDQVSESVEIKYFGLVPEFTGRGVGGPLLSEAVRLAWARAPRRVTVNTCTLDHPSALPNYLARGFIVVRTETEQRVLSP